MTNYALNSRFLPGRFNRMWFALPLNSFAFNASLQLLAQAATNLADGGRSRCFPIKTRVLALEELDYRNGFPPIRAKPTADDFRPVIRSPEELSFA